MAGLTLREQLQGLLALILRERECARALDLEALLAASREKEELLAGLAGAGTPSSADFALAETIRAENRRNAYLFWTTLTWIRQSMELFGRQTAPVSYGAQGRARLHRQGGNLLSGKV